VKVIGRRMDPELDMVSSFQKRGIIMKGELSMALPRDRVKSCGQTDLSIKAESRIIKRMGKASLKLKKGPSPSREYGQMATLSSTMDSSFIEGTPKEA